MPRILRIINRFNLGGPTYNVAYLSKYLEPEYETLLVGGDIDATEDSSEFILNNLGLKPVIIPEMKREINPGYDRQAYKKIKELIKSFQPDIVHTHASKAGTLGRYAAAACNVKVIVHTFHGHVFHSYFGKSKTLLYKSIERYLAGKSDAIIAISEKQKYELSQVHAICDPDKIQVIPLGFDLDRFQENVEQKRKEFRERYMLNDDEIAIAIIGRLVPIKNHTLFLQAIKHISSSTSKKIRAFIVGDGEERQHIEQKASELDINYVDWIKTNEKATLTFTSWIKEIDMVCAGIDIIALTSFNEGTPVSLIEAQATNTPIVSTNVGGIENIVLPNKTALLSKTTDYKAFQSNLLQLVQQEDLRQSLSQHGWQHVKDKFHYARLVKDMDQLYQSLLQQKAKKELS